MFDFHIYFAFIWISLLLCSKIFSLENFISSMEATKSDLDPYLCFKTLFKGYK